jgi:hypothetical protein
MNYFQIFCFLLLLFLPRLETKGPLGKIKTVSQLEILVVAADVTLSTSPSGWARFDEEISLFAETNSPGLKASWAKVSCLNESLVQKHEIDPPIVISKKNQIIDGFVLGDYFRACSSVDISIGYKEVMKTAPLKLAILIEEPEMPILEWKVEGETVEFFIEPRYKDYPNVKFENLFCKCNSMETIR